MSISLPIPASITLSAGKTIVVYRLEDDGSMTRLNTTVNGGTITFTTNHFSTYVITEQDGSGSTGVTSPKTGEF